MRLFFIIVLEVNYRPYLEIFLFVFLIVVIAFLYLELRKRNLFIQTIIEKLDIQDKKSEKEEVIRILSKLQVGDLAKLITKDKFFSDKIRDYIFEGSGDKKLFMHYTQEENVAEKIMEEGFRFTYSFYKTADVISEDKLDLIYKHSRNKYYGKYVVIISISRKIYDYYSDGLKETQSPGVVVEQILTENPPSMNEDEDVVFTLSNKFLKGFFNYETEHITPNPEYDPEFNTDVFEQNLKKIKTLTNWNI